LSLDKSQKAQGLEDDLMNQISPGLRGIEAGTNHHHSIEHLCPMTSNLEISKIKFLGLLEDLPGERRFELKF